MHTNSHGASYIGITKVVEEDSTTESSHRYQILQWLLQESHDAVLPSSSTTTNTGTSSVLTNVTTSRSNDPQPTNGWVWKKRYVLALLSFAIGGQTTWTVPYNYLSNAPTAEMRCPTGTVRVVRIVVTRHWEHACPLTEEHVPG
jgi:hypothetical protein